MDNTADPKKAVEAGVTERPKSAAVKTFADKTTLALWFPRLNDDETSSMRVWLSRRSQVLLLQIVTISVILAVNFALTVFAVGHYTTENGVGVIYQGDCGTVGQLDVWLHFLINLLSTGMLSASNHCMQLQAAPTRENINRAHERNSWLDIGVPSLRNLGYIGRWRRLAWAILAFSSLPIHLIYNSAIFQSLSSSEYTVAVVKDSFANNTTWDLATAERNRKGDIGWDEGRVNPPNFHYLSIIEGIQQGVMNHSYTNMSIASCFDLYDDYFAPQGNVAIFVKNQSLQAVSNDSSLLMYVSIIPRSDDWGKNMWALGNGTGRFLSSSAAANISKPVSTWYLGPQHYEAAYCLVQPSVAGADLCRLEYSPGIMFIVCALNFIKAGVMLFIWLMRRWQAPEQQQQQKQNLYTLGDAIASFMQEPDHTTKNMCLAAKEDFLTRRNLKTRMVKKLPMPSKEPRAYKDDSRRWMAAASPRRWAILLSMCILVILVAVILLATALPNLARRHLPTDIRSLWSMGFGQLTPFTYIVLDLPRDDPAGLIANIIIANLPQFIVSILYIFYNSMLSTYLVQREFSLMYKQRKTLRVSEPIGLQRSSYFISLPLRYGIPLYLSSGVMHWLVSQSLFLARITAKAPDGSKDDVNSFSTCGYSPIAIFITLLVGLGLILAIVIMGFRKYDGTMRMVSTNSRAISAACHAMQEDRANGHLLPIQWGVIKVEDGVGHCSFTTAPAHELLELKPGSLYR